MAIEMVQQPSVQHPSPLPVIPGLSRQYPDTSAWHSASLECPAATLVVPEEDPEHLEPAGFGFDQQHLHLPAVPKTVGSNGVDPVPAHREQPCRPRVRILNNKQAAQPSQQGSTAKEQRQQQAADKQPAPPAAWPGSRSRPQGIIEVGGCLLRCRRRCEA